jgi:hypothetical protein
MALNTGNPFVDALAGTQWANGQSHFHVLFGNTGSGGAWSPSEETLFMSALAAWEAVADVHFTVTTDPYLADLFEYKETAATWAGADDPAADHGLPVTARDRELNAIFEQYGMSVRPQDSIGRYNTSLDYWSSADLQVGGSMYSRDWACARPRSSACGPRSQRRRAQFPQRG